MTAKELKEAQLKLHDEIKEHPFWIKEDAEEFAQSLRDAHELLQNTNSIKITITKQE